MAELRIVVVVVELCNRGKVSLVCKFSAVEILGSFWQ